jgi:apolipoprotein N-acyltransferase
MKRFHLLLLALASAILLWLGWPEGGFPFLLFIGFVPLLLIEDHLYKNQESHSRIAFFNYSFLAMFGWNLLTTYWIYYSTAFGMAMAVILNSLIMAFTLNLFHFAHKKLRHPSSFLCFIIFWISFEYLHLDWDLSWSWLNLGNGFAAYPSMIQWYEYTGMFGGTLWILVMNVMIFLAIKRFRDPARTSKSKWLFASVCCSIILLPILISLGIFYTYQEKGTPASVVVVQPNIDPYNEKFDGMSSEEQIAKFIKLARTKVTAGTELLLGPETAIPEGVWEDRLGETRSVDSLRNLIHKFPDLDVLIGLSSYKMYMPGEEISATARQYPNNGKFYDAYNSAIFMDSTNNILVYHKTKLVTGVEKMPFSKYMKPLEKFALDLGGIVGSLGSQKERTVFNSSGSKIKVAPVICYESIFGEFVSKYVKNGANLIGIMTNDGWWENTSGHKQHLNYARLRAIENRRDVARSANTGISCFIDQKGIMYNRTKWWTDDAIGRIVFLNDEVTFYTNYGDYIARMAYYTTILTMAYLAFMLISNKIRRRNNNLTE